MKKRVLGLAVAAMLLVVQSVSVFAAGSKTADVALTGDSASYYEVEEATSDTFADLAETKSDVVNMILAVNAGTETLQTLAEQMAADLVSELEGKSMVTEFFDLIPINGGIKDADGNYVVTISVPSLTTAATNVKILHYSEVRDVWEIITPSDVNYTNKTITATFQDLSPVAIIADVDTSSTSTTTTTTTTTTSPKTGVASDWSLYVGAAVVLAAAGVAAAVKGKGKVK